MRIIFAGTPDFSVLPLRAIIDAGHEIVAVFTQPDRPAGRGRKLVASPVKESALEHGIPVFQPQSLKDSEIQQIIIDYKPDVMVVVAYGLLLPPEVLTIPAHGCLNIHASLLPRWRGAAPIQRAILAGDKESGVAIMQMDEGLDTGDVILMQKCRIDKSDTGGVLHDRLAEIGATAIIEALQQIENGSVKRVTQPEAGVTYAAKLSKAEAEIDWSDGAENIIRKINAFNPYPVAHTSYRGKKMRLWKASLLAEGSAGKKPGEIVFVDKKRLQIAVGDGVIEILSLQLQGGKRLKTADFINGAKPQVGEILGQD
ncbi:MAG: methionyl-tRNA formyltransferase [Gammaproteobacteria bacterium]|nr:MAG: methionyl-tRNA formyltransferase [Gammaproteobacteria bacterium]